jgi:hypothetical protein
MRGVGWKFRVRLEQVELTHVIFLEGTTLSFVTLHVMDSHSSLLQLKSSLFSTMASAPGDRLSHHLAADCSWLSLSKFVRRGDPA